MRLDYARSVITTLHEFNINLNSREIYLHSFYASGDEEVSEPGVEYRTATTFIKNLNFLNEINNEDILIHQHIVGGFWFDGMAIYDALITSRSRTIMMVHAHATSMSSLTIQGATLRLLMPHVEVLVHDGTYGIEGIPTQVSSAVRAYEKTVEIGNQIYAKRCVNGEYFKKHKMNEKDTINYIRNKIQKRTDWYMDANEAVYYGFADGIIGQDDFTKFFESPKRRNKK